MTYVQWRKADLHIHSEASHDCNSAPKDIVDKIITEGINLFSITDHNNVDKVDIFRELVDQKKAEGHEIEFLPGIEVRTDRGKDGVAVHLLVIFPENSTKQYITDKFLSSDGIQLTRTHLIEKGREKLPDETNEQKLYDKGCEVAYVKFDKVIELAKTLNAITIAPHPKSGAGIERELDFMNRTSTTFRELLINSVMNINAMELPKDFDKAKSGRDFYLNEHNNFIKSMPSVMSSDAHDISSIGKQYTYIKMDSIDFEGLKQIMFEPKLRTMISENELATIKYPHISLFKTSGGYYDSTNFTMSPELNCIIGGRGSGKSTIVDMIRFVFNKYDSNSPDYQEFLDRLYNLLRFDNSVEIGIQHGSRSFTIQRICKITSKKDKVGQTYYEDNSPIPDYRGLDVELYNQGNLKQITRRANEQLKLVDDIGNLQKYHRRINKFRQYLIKNAEEQRAIINSVKEQLLLANERDNLIKEIKEKEFLLVDETIQDFNKIQEDKKYFDLAINNLKKMLLDKQNYFKTIRQYSLIQFPNEGTALTEELEGVFNSITSEISELEKKIIEFIEKSIEGINDITVGNEKWINIYNEAEIRYSEYLKSNGLENIADETSQLKKLKDKLLHIENNVIPTVNLKIEELRGLQTTRKRLIDNYERILDQLKIKRTETCIRISEERDDLNIFISQRQDKKVFRNHIEEIISGQNIKVRDVVNVIVESAPSAKNYRNIIKDQDMKLLESQYKLTSDASGKILARYGNEIPLSTYGLDSISECVFQLDLIYFEDIVEIEIKDSTDGKFKKFSRFSPGQQCAYLLSILLNANSNPLIIDQPEDELDWNYIQTFIDKLRVCKTNHQGQGRQFIFVTHNQNITVLADSENIIKTINIPISDGIQHPTGKIEAQGGLEKSEVKSAVLSLEGGREAFQTRRYKYGLS